MRFATRLPPSFDEMKEALDLLDNMLRYDHAERITPKDAMEHAYFKPIKEGALTNIPVIALCDTKNSLKYIDLVIPCNNDNTQSIAQIFWLLADVAGLTACS